MVFLEQNSLKVANRIDVRDTMESDVVQRIAQSGGVGPDGKKHSSEFAFLDRISGYSPDVESARSGISPSVVTMNATSKSGLGHNGLRGVTDDSSQVRDIGRLRPILEPFNHARL